jgi:hypothetical protein
MRKTLAGAYTHHEVRISLYTGETGERATRSAIVGGSWNPQPNQHQCP